MPENTAVSITIATGATSWSAAAIFSWIVENPGGVTALCCIAGVMVNAIGVGWKMYMDLRKSRQNTQGER